SYAARLREQEVNQAHIVQIDDLKEQIKLWRDRFFGRKSEQTVNPKTPQLAMFDEAENDPLLAVVDDADEEVVVPVKRRGKRKSLA
ncbi:transposase domain-containing protein, partial [Pseudomonas putida]|uniref:transposase domain-containing protein n=1 Tax=Pseudomonas putida TaxID=303 RepID=UPI002A08A7EA|nr:transposase [Pseudomonas putida]